MPSVLLPNSPTRRKVCTGAIPSPRHKLLDAKPHTIRGATPASFFWIPPVLSYWLNDVDGDCCTAEEYFAKAATAAGNPVGTDAEVKAFATKFGVLNGAELTQVMDDVIASGITVAGTTYTDGGYAGVNYADDATLCNALAQGPVKLGVAATQLQNVVGDDSGWFATGFTTDTDEDHCPSLCGYGTQAQCFAALKVPMPSNAIATARGYLMFTWNTIGVIDVPSLLAITGEAWLRTPTTLPFAGPTPSPTPAPIPAPPTPSPRPCPRIRAVLDAHPEWHDAIKEALFGDLISQDI